MDIYRSARTHGVADDDIRHAVAYALAAAEDDEGKCLYLGPDRAGNLLEVVTVMREDSTEIAIHATAMRRAYRQLLPDPGDADG